MINLIGQLYIRMYLVSSPDPPPKRKGGSGEYSAASHHGLAVAMDSGKSSALEVGCWASINWRYVFKGVISKGAQSRWDNCHISQSDCAARNSSEVQKCTIFTRHSFPLEGPGLGFLTTKHFITHLPSKQLQRLSKILHQTLLSRVRVAYRGLGDQGYTLPRDSRSEIFLQ